MKYDGDVNYAANPYGYPPPGEPRRRRGLLALGASVVGIVAFSGVVLYAYKGQDRVGPDGGPPVLEADASPTKLRPEQPGGMDVPHQDKLVYDRLNQSAKDDRPKVEHLLPAPEAPLPRPVVTPQVQPLPTPQPPAVAPVPPPPAGSTTTVPRGPADVIPTLAPPPVQVQAGLPPALPPGGQSSQVAALPSAPPKAPPPVAKTAPQPAVAAPPKPAPAPAPQVATAPGAQTPPKAAPAQPVQPVQPAATQPPKPPAPAAGGGGYRVQLASVRSEAEAAAEWKRLISKHPDLAGLSMQVAKADLGEKGVFYRVQGGSTDEARAKSICDKLKAQNVGCVVVRP